MVVGGSSEILKNDHRRYSQVTYAARQINWSLQSAISLDKYCLIPFWTTFHGAADEIHAAGGKCTIDIPLYPNLNLLLANPETACMYYFWSKNIIVESGAQFQPTVLKLTAESYLAYVKHITTC